MASNNYLLWENERYSIKTPFHPHLPYEEGLHVMLAPKADYENAWQDPDVAGEAFRLAARACQLIEAAGLAPWFNIQANGNWGLLPGARKFFHIHIYGRNHTQNWGKPLVLPEAPGTHNYEPMPEAERNRLVEILATLT